MTSYFTTQEVRLDDNKIYIYQISKNVHDNYKYIKTGFNAINCDCLPSWFLSHTILSVCVVLVAFLNKASITFGL